MAAQLDPQIYLDASFIAYESNPAASLGKFLPQYNLIQPVTLKDGFQAYVLQSKGADSHVLIAFKGTDPAFGVMIDAAKRVAVDEMVMNSGVPQRLLMQRQYEHDLNVLQENPSYQDLLTDLQIFQGENVAQFSDALALVTNYTARNIAVHVTGHSLGGGIANFVAGQRSGITGMTFAAPGYKSYGNASAASMINYYNVNDTIPTVNLEYHCGALKPLDHLYSSFAVEHELGLRSAIIYGFNQTPDITTAITAHNDQVASLVAGSLGFLIARFIFHDLGNYALLLKRAARNGKTHINTIHDFANAAHDFVIKANWLQRERQNPGHGLQTFFWRLMAAEGKFELDSASMGWYMPP